MEKKEDIPLLSKIKSEEVVDTNYYIYYPTELHRRDDKRWYGPGTDVKAMLGHMKDLTQHMLWGKAWHTLMK